MKFEFDSQTMKDLDIFPAKEGSNSIFSLYNHTVTNGGTDRLLSFFNNPLNDIAFLNERKRNIQFLYSNKLTFKFNYHQYDFIEYYLRLGRIPLRDNPLDAFMDKISYLFKPSNDYYNIKTGIQQLIYMSGQIKTFLEETKGLEKPSFYKDIEEKFADYVGLINNNVKFTKNKSIKSRYVNRLDRLLRKTKKDFIHDLLNDLYTLDCYCSATKMIDKYGFVFAKYNSSDKPNIKIESLFHPFLENPVSNNIELGIDKNLCFLTGPNMAGKSTFLKAIGLTVYLAHIGFPVPAKSMETSVFNGLVTTINLSDNINMGYSHYYSEVRRVKETSLKILDNKNILVIYDELFRGTNVKDAMEASYRIINELSKINDCLFLISTHINEISDNLDSEKNILYKYFDSTLEKEEPVYDYKLKDGISSERMGIRIIEKEGVFEIFEKISKRQGK